MQDFEKKQLQKRVEQERSSFEYSPENPPPLEILESKVFAVHATPILPESGVLKAGARDTSISDKWQGGEPPSFRPTIHFSLGELVQEHSGFSWEKKPYAVISPLKNLKSQLVNVLPQDTFVLGDLQLQEGMVVLVPRGTDVSKLPEGVEIKEYDLETGLRQAVDSVISEKQGWHIQMKPEGVSIGSVAFIEDVEINDSKFFQSLFETYPHISFGTHINPERGDAFRFGLIEQILTIAMRNYSDHGHKHSTVEVLLHRSLILHNLQKIEQALENASIHPQAIETFEVKKANVFGWLNIIDCDLEARQSLGKTLTGAPESVHKMVRIRRNDPAKLRECVDERHTQLPDAVQESELSPTNLAAMLCGMSAQELEEFQGNNAMVFSHVALPEFYSHYATQRWIVVKNEQAHSKGLDELLAHSLEQVSTTPNQRDGIFEDLKEFLNEESNRLEVALTILRNPSVQKHLAERLGMHFERDAPTQLQEVIAAHPQTRILFEDQELSLSDEQKEAYQLLEEIGRVDNPLIYLDGALKKFKTATSLALRMELGRARLHEYLETVSKPMNMVRDLSDLEIGDELTLYEILRQIGKPAEIWQKVGLEKEYRNMFKTDSAFWSSDKSLIEIYRILKADRTYS